MATAAKISIQIDAQTASLQKGFGEATAAINKLDAGMSGSVAAGMAKFQIGLAAVQGVLATLRGAFDSVLAAMDRMGQMDETATRLGMTADALTVLGYAAEQTGSSQEGMNAGLEKMQKNLAEAAAGGGAAKDAFAELGLSAKDLAGQSTDKVFAAIAEQMQGVGSNTDKTRLAMDIFGKSGGQFINLLSGGAEGLNAFGKEAEDIGLLLGDARGAVESTGDSINKMKRAWGAMWEQLTVLVAPAIAAVAEGLATVVGWFNQLLGLSTGAAAPFKAYASEADKAANAIEKTMRKTVRASEKSAAAVKQTWQNIPKPSDWTTPGIGAVSRASTAGFSAVQEANRAKQDADRRHNDIVAWLAKINQAQRDSTTTLAPVNI